jgi:hypothetical protein
MENRLHDPDILEVIRILSSQAVSGSLQITTGMTEGAVFFDRGEIVDARLGRLTGFQAINAIASVRDADFNFDASIAPPVRNLITPNERMLLKDFFGIGAAYYEPHYVHEPHYVDEPQHAAEEPHFTEEVTGPDVVPPEQVVPLSDLDERPTLNDADEVTLVRSNERPVRHEPIIAYEPASRPTYRPALLIAIVTILLVGAGVALLYRFRDQRSSTAAPATAQITSSPSDASAPAADLNGNWKVINTVEQTSYEPYKNLKVGFDLAINQSGNEFTGKGQKVSENGQSLPATSRTPILVKGSIDGDKVEAVFSETGAVRKTSGRFVWRIDKANGGLNGTFVSTAARTSGKSAATKGL